MSRRFELLRGDIVLGVVTLDAGASDFPWLVGWLEPSPAFAQVEPIFAEMSRVLEDERFTDESDKLHERVMEPGVRMQSLPDGKWSEIVGISIEGRRVSWRI